MLEKAPSRGADALILDLEDSVAASAKEDALQAVAEWLANWNREAPEIWVRVNPTRLNEEIPAIVGPGLTGIVLPKASTASLAALDAALRDVEPVRGREPESIAVAPLVETAPALLSIVAIAAGPRVRHIVLGEADLVSELRLQPAKEAWELAPLRASAVIASAAAGVAAPVGSTSTDYSDLGELQRSTEALRRMGFRGRSAIHPAQVPVINDVFIPTSDDVAKASRLLARFEEARERGEGVITDEEGRMVDKAVIRSARETLSLARRSGTG